jgi:hypothetical protein
MKSNVDQGVCYPQPTSLKQRLAIASDFAQRFKFPLPMGVDPMGDVADHLYSGWPERLYIVDESGKLVYCGGMGPFNYNPAEVRTWLAKRFPAPQVKSGTAMADAASPPAH